MNTVTIIMLVLITILVIIFLLKKKVLYFTSNLPNIFFPIFLLIALISIFSFNPFLKLSDYTFEKTGILNTIKNLDQRIYEISPKNLLDKAKQKSDNLMDKVSDWLKKEEKKEENKQESSKDELKEAGILEQELYPKLVFVLAVVYKIVIVILSILGLVLCIYFSYSMESIRDNANLRKEYRRLKERVKRLEEKKF